MLSAMFTAASAGLLQMQHMFGTAALATITNLSVEGFVSLHRMIYWCTGVSSRMFMSREGDRAERRAGHRAPLP